MGNGSVLRSLCACLCAIALVFSLLPYGSLYADELEEGDGQLSVLAAEEDSGDQPSTTGIEDDEPLSAIPAEDASSEEENNSSAESSGEILVIFDDQQDGGIHSLSESAYESLEEAQLEISETVIEANEDFGTMVLVEVPTDTDEESLIEQVSEMPGVAYAQPNYTYYLEEDDESLGLEGDYSVEYTPNDPAVANNSQWHLGSSGGGANVLNAWNSAKCSYNVSIAVLDTGVRVDHEDLVGTISNEYMWDAYNQTAYGTITSSGVANGDNSGHGTHVCGIAAATADNGKGGAGSSFNAKLIPIKVFDDKASSPSASSSSILRAYNYLLSLIRSGKVTDLHVINLSLGGYGNNVFDSALRQAVKTARNNYDIISVCSGGNSSGSSTPRTDFHAPSDYEECFGVTSLTSAGMNNYLSDYNEHKDISAAGVGIYSTLATSSSGYGLKSGTSMASPLAAGVFALLWSKYPYLTVDEAEQAVRKSAIEIVDPSNDRRSTSGSAGRLNAKGALDYLSGNYSVSGKKAINDCEIEAIGTQLYTGSALTPEPRIKSGSTTLKKGVDYSLSYYNNIAVGQASVVIEGMGNYLGYTVKTFDIKLDINSVTVTGLASSYVYTGSAIAPGFTLKAGATLALYQDYSVVYSNNVKVGTATITLTGKGNYTGTKKLTFAITQASLDSVSISGVAASYNYTGNPITPNPTLTFNSKTLTKGTDYTIAYSSNTDGGTATITITGKGNFKGSKKISFKIVGMPLTGALITKIENLYWYEGKALSPLPTVTLKGKVLTRGSDYTVSYRLNDSAGNPSGAKLSSLTQPGSYTLTAEGKDSYKGSVSLKFNVKAVTQLAGNGAHRYQTMAHIVQTGFSNNSCSTIVVSTGDTFADALTGTALAGLYNAPLITTDSRTLSAEAAQEIARIGTASTKIYILGSTSSVSSEIESSLKSMAKVSSVERLYGPTRLETALKVYNAGKGKWSDTAIIVNGASFADALSIAPYAYRSHSPLFLTNNNRELEQDAINAIKKGGFKKVLILGSDASVSESVKRQLGENSFKYLRLSGPNRYETSSAVVRWASGKAPEALFQPNTVLGLNNLSITTGDKFADALSGAALCGVRNSVMILVNDTEIGQHGIKSHIPSNKNSIFQVYSLGSDVTVSRSVQNQVKTYLR